MDTDDLNRAIGRLEGRIETVQADVAEIKCEIKSLTAFKLKVAGGAAVISALVTFAGWLLGVIK